MIDLGKRNILGVQVNAVDYEAVSDRIVLAARMGRPLTVSALAVHGIMTGVSDPEHRYRLNHSDLVVPDGQPVRWALDLLYHTRLPDRVYGPTLMLKVCERAAKDALPIYLYGSRPNVIKSLARNLRDWFPKLSIAGLQYSLFRQVSHEEKMQVVQDIRDSGAAITFVGLGCPRQEIWAYEHRDLLSMPIIAVGAAFDFHAKILPQAPAYMQRLGCEWLFRLIREPRRLWKRYVLLNPLYLGLLALQSVGLRQYDPTQAAPPIQEMRYG